MSLLWVSYREKYRLCAYGSELAGLYPGATLPANRFVLLLYKSGRKFFEFVFKVDFDPLFFLSLCFRLCRVKPEHVILLKSYEVSFIGLKVLKKLCSANTRFSLVVFDNISLIHNRPKRWSDQFFNQFDTIWVA